jgi:dihydrofolate reductase
MKFYRELTICSDTIAVENRYALREQIRQKSFSSFNEFLNHCKDQTDLPPLHLDKPNAVVMGRKTWDSLPDRFRPLPNRLNVVLSKKKHDEGGKEIVLARSLEKALDHLSSKSIANIFVIGGGRVYEESIRHPQCQALYLTQIDNAFDCDTIFPDFTSNFALRATGHSVLESDIPYQFTAFERSSAPVE